MSDTSCVAVVARTSPRHFWRSEAHPGLLPTAHRTLSPFSPSHTTSVEALDFPLVCRVGLYLVFLYGGKLFGQYN